MHENKYIIFIGWLDASAVDPRGGSGSRELVAAGEARALDERPQARDVDGAAIVAAATRVGPSEVTTPIHVVANARADACATARA